MPPCRAAGMPPSIAQAMLLTHAQLWQGRPTRRERDRKFEAWKCNRREAVLQGYTCARASDSWLFQFAMWFVGDARTPAYDPSDPHRRSVLGRSFVTVI